MPRRERVVVGVDGGRSVKRHVETEQDALVHGNDSARYRRRCARVADATETRETRRRGAPSEDLKTRDVKLTVSRIHGAVQRRKIKGLRDADNRRLKFGGAIVEQHTEEFRVVETNVDERVVERAHSRA